MNIPIDISNTVLNTKRLTLRPWQENDLEDFYEYARVDGVGQMAGWLPHENIEVSRRILDSFIGGKKTFALEYHGKVIGSLGIEKYSEDQFPELADLKVRELGYVLSRDYWGQGLMPEAVEEVLRYLFEDVGVDAVACAYFKRNAQSARVQEKCGFRYVRDVIHTTRYETEELTATNLLTREDWLCRKA